MQIELLDVFGDDLTVVNAARIVLPQNMMTECIETGSLSAYARLYNLRTDPTAQREIAELATKLGELFSSKFPVS
jgi:thymidylate synthase ThyX